MEIFKIGTIRIRIKNSINLFHMKTYTRLFCVMAGAIGVIGIAESIATFSLFQTLVSVGMVWLAFAVSSDVNNELKDEGKQS